MPIQIPEAFRFLWATHADDGTPVRYRCAFGGRGSGKSMSFAIALVLKGAVEPLKILCAREIQGSIKDSVKAEIEAAIEFCGLGAFYEVLDQEIRGANGTLFIFSGLRHHGSGKNSGVNSVKSKKGINIAWIEEASTVSQVSIDVLEPTIREPGSEIWFTWNPGKADDPVDAMFRGEHLPPGALVRRVNYDDNPWFGETPLARKLEYDRQRDPDKYAHVWLGEYQRNSEARVFRNWTVENFETPADAMLRFGADWGFAVDPTTLVRGFIGRFENGQAIADPKGRTLFVDAEAYEIGCEIDHTPALFETVEGSRKWLITADGARPETVSYMKRQGFKIVPAIKGPGSVEDGIEFLRTFDIVVHPRCRHAIEELTLYSWKTDPLTGEILPVLADKDNHVIDALRYAVEALRRAKPAARPERPERKRHTDYRGQRGGGGDEWMAA